MLCTQGNFMVLEVVNNEGHVMPSHFFAQGLQVNAAAYITVLEAVVKPWIDSVRSESHNMLDFLRATITRVMTHMDKDPLIRACKRFRQRIEAVTAAEGDFIE
ncbi:hypothetical protein ALC53_13428 [Atta colombica]|uniref:Uncharacterized protein n=1 Tax=Atta colombica TaxID=520822 RepID=A0A195AVT2_9HYME|nr:hypothetical protein ALC53_13428 [Atta colombica]